MKDNPPAPYLFFTGTSSGKTSLNRFHSSFIIYSGSGLHLFDCGDGISKALLFHKIDVTLIDSIILSHFHADHICGLPSLLTQMKMHGRRKKLTIYTYEKETENLRRFITQTYLFINRLPYEVIIYGFSQDEDFHTEQGIRILSRPTSHLQKYRNEDAAGSLSFYCSSFLIDVNGKRIHFTGDIASADDLSIFSDMNPDIVISEFAHISREEMEDFVNQFRGNVILTHYDDGAPALYYENTTGERPSSPLFATDGYILNL